jgi:3-deoxy-manno-octulosonate cytidylyltransferase (CMP-KDO synthetase)
MTAPEVIIIIPARHASSRYPGKPLAVLRGATGRAASLLERSYRAATQAAAALPGGAAVHVATDDDRIAAEAARIGAPVVMTSPDCRNGTERVAQAVERLGIDPGIVVNLQGDAPLTPPHFVTELVAALRAMPEAGIATPVLRCDVESVQNFIADRAAGRVGATTVVRNRLGQALYFSKEVIPFTNARGVVDGRVPVFHHVGLYAYRPAALAAYVAWPQGELELLEGLEQLRFLENGHPVHAVEVSAPGAVFWELNNPSDVPLIEGYLARMGME